jgi:outer membrane protein TolC
MAYKYVLRFVFVCLLTGGYYTSAAAQALPVPLPRPSPDDKRVEQLPDSLSLAASDSGSAAFHLTLDDAKSRALENSVIMEMASEQIIAKCHALTAAQKDYLPKLLNSLVYFHFDSDLGKVVTTPGIFNPATAITVPIVQQDSTIYTAMAVQPITALLKVRQAVNISEVDVATAQAEKQFARRELTKGVEQLYFGLLTAQHIRAGLGQALAGAQQLAASTNSPDAKMSIVELQQNQLTVDAQIVTVSEQLNQLINLPACTELRLDEPPAPQNPFGCADDVVGAAVSSSPKIREARLQVDKAEAAVRLAQADFYPSVNAYGFYVNQDSTPVIQDGFTGVGVSASYMLEWGKKNDTLRQWKATEVLARKNLLKEIQDSQLNAAKAFHEANRTKQALEYAQQLAKLNQEAPLPTDPFQFKFAVKSRLESELGAIKADLDYRNALIELRSITGQAE